LVLREYGDLVAQHEQLDARSGLIDMGNPSAGLANDKIFWEPRPRPDPAP
jgi:hypothetical protein